MAIPDRLAGEVCVGLLAGLGAEIVRGADATADIVVGPPATPALGGKGAIQCHISAAGEAGDPGLADDASELMLQAWGGLMAATGEADGPPRVVDVALIEIFAAINAATAALAALRLVEAGREPAHIDIALADASAALLGIFLPHVLVGKIGGFREGCRHPICAPWNAYPTLDGSVMLCSSSDAHWQRLLDVIGAADAKRDARFADMSARRRNVDAADALVAAWASGVATDAAVRALSEAGIPAGPIRTPEALLAEGTIEMVEFDLPNGGEGRRGTFPVRPADLPSPAPGPYPAARAPIPDLPLSGVRVLQLGPFTAGPLAGRLLSDLGADVVKIEPPGGEVSRGWSPRFGGESGYFANNNAGMRSIALDLASGEGRATFDRLLGAADVLVQNLKTGALDRLGFGAERVLARRPAFIYCSISGYGATGSGQPALDTVIQAASGIMSRVEAGQGACKVGFSVGDLMAAHLAPLMVLAALRHRDRTGQGQHVDISMLHGLFWATQVAGDRPALGPFRRIAATDGWIVVAADAAALRDSLGDNPLARSCEALLETLRGSGLRAMRVREPGEVVADPLLTRRAMLRTMQAADGSPVTVLGAPYGLAAHLTRMPRPVGLADADRERVLREWTPRC
jgi:crotonobetainyl-CoA:carnitine CoA-transferase CaiB-like acyl-CoA transferase